MQVDYLLIGQGISGTFLSWELQKAGRSVLVIDAAHPRSASKVASGVINPVTGRRIVKTWMIDELMPFAWEAYQSIGRDLQIDCIAQKDIIDCFSTPQMRLSFIDRYEKDRQYLALPTDENDKLDLLYYDFGYGIIHPCYWIDLALLLPAWRNRLLEKDQLLEETFEIGELVVKDDGIQYRDINTRKIIFCDGVAGFTNPFFDRLPYGANKGEALLVEIPGLPDGQIIKKGYSLVPWKENIFWLGSTYLWEFEDTEPTPGFYQFARNWLQLTVKDPFAIVDHLAALRPATLERRPFIGLHPLHPAVGIFNGMGTKGCSLAPYFARQLVNLLVDNTPVQADADVQRFKRILSR
ncbi:MAG TPA: FAD-dependent oxidoreductase [Chitinophagaceae bacterium]